MSGSAQMQSGLYMTNITMDNIVIRESSWNATPAVGATIFSVGFMVGGHAHGNKLRIENCEVPTSGDDCFEVGAFLDVELRNCVGGNARSEAYYFRNIGGMPTPELQNVRVIGCRVKDNVYSSTGFFVHSTSSTPVGHFSFIDCEYEAVGSPTWFGGGNVVYAGALVGCVARFSR